MADFQPTPAAQLTNENIKCLKTLITFAINTIQVVLITSGSRT